MSQRKNLVLYRKDYQSTRQKQLAVRFFPESELGIISESFPERFRGALEHSIVY